MPVSALIVSAVLAFAAPARAADDRELVRVNGTPIRQSELFERLWQRYGPETLDEMINELVLRQAVAAKGVKVEPAEVDARVQELREGLPDPKSFERQLEQTGTTLDKFKSDLADQMRAEKFVAAERKLSVSDEEVKKAFLEHKQELGAPESVHLRHIAVASKAEAEELASKVKAGADFAALARQKSLVPSAKANGGDYGFVAKGMLPPELDKVVFSMKPGDVRVEQGGKEFHVVQVLERRAPAPASFDKVKGEVRRLVLREKIRAALPELIKQLREKADVQPQGV